jgi:hypothetical protein
MIEDFADVSFLSLQFSRNIIDFIVPAASSSLTDRSDLRYLLTIEVPTYVGSVVFEELKTLEGREKPIYINQGVEIYEGARFAFNRGRDGMIDSLLTYTKPTRNQTGMSAVLTQVTPYRLTSQVLGGEPAQNTTLASAPFYAIKAGLSREDFAANSDTYWTDFQAKYRNFLTWQPNNKRVAAGQEEYLSFLLNFSPTPTQLRLRARFSGPGLETTLPQTILTLSGVPMYGIVCLPVGPDVVTVGMEEYDFYEVWLSDQENKRLSEVRKYQVDRSYQAFDRGILFVNSLGGWDTLRCLGRASETLAVNQTTAMREMTRKNDVEFSDLLFIKTEGRRSVQLSTGYFRQEAAETLRWLDELLLSESCFWITDKGHLPIQIISNTLVDAEDDSDLTARVLTFKLLDEVTNFSTIPLNFSPVTRPTVWVGANENYSLDGFGKRTGTVAYSTLKKVYQNNYELVLPPQIKPNAPGDPDYIPAFVDAGVVIGSTPYPNTEISRLTTFLKNDCGGGTGTAALIVIPAAKYGGEVPGAAQILAEAEYAALNTQAYANANGSCIP